MSSPEAPLLKRLPVLLGLAAAAAVLGGCGQGGFQPLYGVTGSTARANEKLSSVTIAPIPGRIGQRIRNELMFEKSASGVTSAATSRLDIAFSESILTSLVNAKGDSAGQIYQIEAKYKLIDLSTNKPLFEGRSLGRAAFDRFEAIYSNIRAREDAENRVAKSVADDIRTRVTAYLATSSTN